MNNSPVLRIMLILTLCSGLTLVFNGAGCAPKRYVKEEPAEKGLAGSGTSEKHAAEPASPAPAAEDKEVSRAPESKERIKVDEEISKKKEPLLSKVRELESSKKESMRKSKSTESEGYLDAPMLISDADTKGRSRASLSGGSAPSVKAGSHNDNEEFPFYQDYCKRYRDRDNPYPWKITERYIVKVTDRDSAPVANQSVVISDKSGKQVFSAKTLASGEFVLLPLMDLGNYKTITDYTIAAGGGPVPIVKGTEDRIPVVLPSKRKEMDTVFVQVCFLIDATGSMSDEIKQLQDVVFSIHQRLLALPSKPRIRFSVVAYRDKGDEFVVKGFHFTSSIDSFQTWVESLQANGGGDYPEELETGMFYCLDSLWWDPAAIKFIFQIGDAPPHLNEKERNYLKAARLFRERGIMMCPIGASGLKSDGEFVYRQLAVVTHGEFVFLHYGEQGESDGSETEADPGKVSHHTGSNYTVRRLDDIVVGIVANELGYCTSPNLITHEFPKPADESELLETRMLSLLRQVIRPETSLKGKALVLSPVAVSDTSLSSLSEYIWELSLEKLRTVTDATVIERQRLQEILKEHALSLSGVTEEKKDAELGKILNADFMLLSKLHYLGAVRMCHMRLVDCKTGNIMGAARVRL